MSVSEHVTVLHCIDGFQESLEESANKSQPVESVEEPHRSEARDDNEKDHGEVERPDEDDEDSVAKHFRQWRVPRIEAAKVFLLQRSFPHLLPEEYWKWKGIRRNNDILQVRFPSVDACAFCLPSLMTWFEGD